MTTDEIKFKIWCLKQDNLRLGDIIDRSRSEEHISLCSQHKRDNEKKINILRAKLKELQKTEQKKTGERKTIYQRTTVRCPCFL